jgi:ParB family chromosome partitioning protein
MARTKKPRLGRGLSSLLSTPAPVEVPAGAEEPAKLTPPKPAAGDPAHASAIHVDAAVEAVAKAKDKEREAGDRAQDVSRTLDTETGGTEDAVVDRVAKGMSGQESTGSSETEEQAGGAAAAVAHDGAKLVYLPIEAIRPNPHQPRQSIDQSALERLSDSIRQDGLMQPVVVRKAGSDGQYELVAGERRMRAAGLAGLTKLPAVVRELDDRQMAEWALIENLQREDLNPIERARAFKRLVENFNVSHEQVAERVGIERPTVSNTLRLLELHHEVQNAMREGQLSAGHGRALLGLPEPAMQRAMARRAIAGGWSVRMVEAAVRRASRAGDGASGGGGGRHRSPHLEDLERQLTAQLQTKVHIKTGRKKGTGTVKIEFYNLDQFDSLLTRLGVELE